MEKVGKSEQLQAFSDSIGKEYQEAQKSRDELELSLFNISKNLQRKVRLLLSEAVNKMELTTTFQKIRNDLVRQMKPAEHAWHSFLDELVERWELIEGMDDTGLENTVEISISLDQPEKQITLECVSDEASIALEIKGSRILADYPSVLFKVTPEAGWGSMVLVDSKIVDIEDKLLAADAFINTFGRLLES